MMRIFQRDTDKNGNVNETHFDGGYGGGGVVVYAGQEPSPGI